MVDISHQKSTISCLTVEIVSCIIIAGGDSMREINLSEMLITKRREMGITQEELAAHVGVGKVP